MGGTLAKYAAEGVRVALLTATRGERGRFHHARPGDDGHPGERALAELREYFESFWEDALAAFKEAAEKGEPDAGDE